MRIIAIDRHQRMYEWTLPECRNLHGWYQQVHVHMRSRIHGGVVSDKWVALQGWHAGVSLLIYCQWSGYKWKWNQSNCLLGLRAISTYSRTPPTHFQTSYQSHNLILYILNNYWWITCKFVIENWTVSDLYFTLYLNSKISHTTIETSFNILKIWPYVRRS